MNPNNVIANSILDTDSYKLSHALMYPEGTKRVYSYFECRKGAKFTIQKMFGLQFILDQLAKPVTQADLDEATILANSHGVPLYREGWQYIIDTYEGRLPVEIRAIKEGTVLPVSNALITVECLDHKTWWLTNYLETQLSRVWYPITIATLSYQLKCLLKKYLDETADENGKKIIDFQLHDFGARGVTCREQAMIGGAAHLTNFLGTDTILGMHGLRQYYGAVGAPGYSVFATEHSIMTSYGREAEPQLVEDLLIKYPKGILSLVIDSYDYQNFISGIADGLKDQILARDGKTVFRPDSGDPVETSLDVFERLWKVFGGTINEKGFRVLNPKVGMLWGDGIDMQGIDAILFAFVNAGICASNIVFGSGGGLLQKVNRDTMRCAFKCSAQYRNGEWIDIMKNPLDASKASKKGRLGVITTDEGIVTVKTTDPRYRADKDLLIPVFRNGQVLVRYNLADVRSSW